MKQLKSSIKRHIKFLVNKILQPYFSELFMHEKYSFSVKVAQKALFLRYKEMLRGGFCPSIDDTGYRVFSQFDEDGIFAFLFAVIGDETRIFIDIGSSDGINSNCANLAINFGWHGLFIDGNPEAIARGKAFYERHPDTWVYPPKFVCGMVKRSNINRLITSAGFAGEVDLLSIDIDGNDYWIWDALECISPRVVCIETHIEFGLNNIVVPYDENFVRSRVHPDYFGASPVAMNNLAKRKGYRLVGANSYGFNTIYVRNDIDLIPEVSVEHILRHPGNQEWFKIFDSVKDMPFLEG